MSEVFMRAFPAKIEQRGPRTLTGRLVPYDVIADVLDELDDGGFDVYKEGFKRGAFDGQVLTGERNKGVLTKIGLIHRHDGGLGYLGPFIGLRNAADGLWGDVNVLPSKVDDVGALLESGVDELSVEFRLRPGDNTFVDPQGVRWRTRAHLDQVALEPKGAYRTAQVLAFRSEHDELEAQKAKEEADRAAEEKRQQDEETLLKLEAERAERAAAEAVERKRKFDEYSERLERERKKQDELVREYGIQKPPLTSHRG